MSASPSEAEHAAPPLKRPASETLHRNGLGGQKVNRKQDHEQNGLVAAPNVDLSQEMVGEMIASYSFAANATVMQADDRMTKTLLDVTA